MNIVGTQYIPPSKRKPVEPKTAETQPQTAESAVPPDDAPKNGPEIQPKLGVTIETAEVKAKKKSKKSDKPTSGITVSVADAAATDETLLDEIPFSEDHFILRMPPDLDETRTLQEMVCDRKQLDGFIQINMHEPRKGSVKIGELTLPCKLVDLPCIIEAQKTFDNKQFYKVGDISQMLLVSKDENFQNKHACVPDCGWPDGLTPPLRRVRTKRFRKRLVAKSAESIEAAVQALLESDSMADEISYHLINPDPNNDKTGGFARDGRRESLMSHGYSLTGSPAGSDGWGDGGLEDILGISDATGDIVEDDDDDEIEDDLGVSATQETDGGFRPEGKDEPTVEHKECQIASSEEESDYSSEEESEEITDSNEEEDVNDEVYLLTEEIQRLSQKMCDLRTKIDAAANVVLKSRLEDDLPELQSILEFKQKQLAKLTNNS